MLRFAPLLIFFSVFFIGCDAVHTSTQAAAATGEPSFVSGIVPGRYVVIYRSPRVPGHAAAPDHDAEAHILSRLDRFGITVQQMDPVTDVENLAQLSAQPGVKSFCMTDMFTETASVSFPLRCPAAARQMLSTPRRRAGPFARPEAMVKAFQGGLPPAHGTRAWAPGFESQYLTPA